MRRGREEGKNCIVEKERHNFGLHLTWVETFVLFACLLLCFTLSSWYVCLSLCFVIVAVFFPITHVYVFIVESTLRSMHIFIGLCLCRFLGMHRLLLDYLV